MASSGAGTKGTFEPIQQAQSQQKPGLEKKLAPTSESTKLESEGGFIEYVGCGKLKDKKVLITGGDSGIGRSVAILMAREGADITIVYLPEEQEDAQETKKAIERENRKCVLSAGNLMDNETCKRAVDEHVKNYGGVDVLVNNASKQMMCPKLEDIDLGDVESTFRSNILQMFAITKYTLPYMKKGGSIINTSSVTTFRGSSSMVDYTSSKGAIIGFTRALAKQLEPRGIRVNAVAPGPVHTPIQPDSRPAEQMKGFGSKTVLGRPGQPSEVAPTYVWLASAEGALYYGQVMHPYPLGD
ncbi:hypothetical protein AJ80_04699 [Polytolypa hystricis UAMH7299]|uniref:Oxidoreductase n=1 Tax=Polytolypa hystricis (strain UAMH7299) TaxID=1447883 RepID=A0A2B7Y9Z6_POLH7|nr:hypothetical protein AJ80_04699 [Polytolypa hystricis UAMH7299]